MRAVINNMLSFIYKVSDNLCDTYYLNVNNSFKHGLIWDLNIGFKCIKINMFILLLNINITLIYLWIKFVIKTLVVSNYDFSKILYILITLGFLNIFL